MPVAGLIDDRPHLDAGAVHVDDELGQPCVGWRIRVGPGDQVAPVGMGRAARPHLGPGHDPVAGTLPVRAGPGADRCHVGSGVGLAQPDAPHRRARQDPRQPTLLLAGGGELQQRRADLPVGEVDRRQGRTRADERLEHDEPLECTAATASHLGRPGHADPTALGERAGEVAVVADQPAVFSGPPPVGTPASDLGGLLGEELQFGGHGEVHTQTLPGRPGPSAVRAG